MQTSRHSNNNSLRVPCVLMRGGTSRGPFFLEADLPRDPKERERFLIAAHGLPPRAPGGRHRRRQSDDQQGRDHRPSSQPGADVDYLFAQVAIDRAFVDFGPNCGNMLSAVGPFAIEAGLVPAELARRPSGSSTAIPRPRSRPWSRPHPASSNTRARPRSTACPAPQRRSS